MKKNSNLATLFERICAFFIDMLIVSFVATLLISPLQKIDDNKYSKELNRVIEEYKEGKISAKVYFNRYSDINYDVTRQQGLSVIIEIFIYILYFVVLQFKLKGQTLGKKIMKIKVKKEDDSDLEINDLIFRSLFINSIFYNIVLICIVLFTNKDIYLYGNSILLFLQYIFIFVSIILIVVKSKKQGLHDMMVHTIVISTKRENSI